MSILVELEETAGEARTPAAALSELKQAGCIVVKGADRPIALFYHEGQVRAVDNRCPHMGFPLHRGPLQDGILICPWHHARFDLASGCTFDLWADDVPSYPVEIEGDNVFIGAPVQSDPRGRAFRRLRIGMEQNVGLIVCKSVIGLLKEGVSIPDLVRETALYGTRNRDSWGSGLVILTAMANIAADLPTDHAALALSQGVAAVARDTSGMSPRRDRYPLDRPEMDLETARRWFRHWTLARHRDGAERTLLTVLEQGCTPAEASDIIFSAITDRFYADAGHTLDFANKAFETVEMIGWEYARDLLPALVPGITGSRGGEESSPWRSPIDLVAMLQAAADRIPDALCTGEGKDWSGEADLANQLLGEDPAAIVESLLQALSSGARPLQLGRALALAAALRIAHFGTANEFGDWDTALHTFTYASAMHQVLRRCSTPAILRGVFHGAMSLYLDRFLNIPPAPLPLSDAEISDLPDREQEILDALLECMNRQQQVGAAARLASRYAALNLPDTPLLAALAYGTVREDASFHTFQMLEAGTRQYQEWKGTPQGRLILIALARYIAAHAPTTRSFLQTFDIARRLHRGETLYEE